MQRGGKTFMAGYNKYSGVLSLLGLCHLVSCGASLIEVNLGALEVRKSRTIFTEMYYVLGPFIQIFYSCL